jgi:hypothetical protein
MNCLLLHVILVYVDEITNICFHFLSDTDVGAIGIGCSHGLTEIPLKFSHLSTVNVCEHCNVAADSLAELWVYYIVFPTYTSDVKPAFVITQPTFRFVFSSHVVCLSRVLNERACVLCRHTAKHRIWLCF